MRHGQVGRVMIRRRKVTVLTYADDVTLVAKDEREMKCMLKRFEIYLKRKKLVLNVKEINMMIFKKAGREKEIKWEWFRSGNSREEK